MDANDRNESTIRERDARLARRLGEALDQLNPPGGVTGCPDAEVIAAYSERALGADESAQCENHFASCERCRNILRVLAAGSEAPLAETEVAQLGQRVAAVSRPVEITSGTAKRPRSKAAAWSTRWLAPAFGVAAVLTVWFVLRPPWRAMDRSGSTTLIAQAPREEMPEPAPLAADRAQKLAPPPQVPSAKTAASNLDAEPSANHPLKSKASTRENPRDESYVKGYAGEKKEVAPPAGEHESKTLSAPSSVTPPAPPPAVSSAMRSPAALPPPQALTDSTASAANDARLQASQSARVAGAAPQIETTNGTLGSPMQQPPAADVPMNGRNYQALSKLNSVRRAPVLFKPVSGTAVWRAGLAGVIERSTDQGKTWSPQVSPSREDWLAGAAVSDTVAWLAGRNGAIASTADGKDWQSVAAPSKAAATGGKLPDWTGVAVRDAQSATVTAGDGSKFATTDGGKTWQQQ